MKSSGTLSSINYLKGAKKMGGMIYPINDPVQDSIDALNAAIDRLDKVINDMKEMGQK